MPDVASASARPFHRRDTAACLSLFDSNVPDFFSDGEREEFAAFLGELPGPYLVIESAAEVVGCGGYAYREAGTIADLCWGMVRRDLHGKGFGRLLTQERLALAMGESAVQQVALSTSQQTVGFYQRFGFTVQSVTPEGYGPGHDRCDMRRKMT